MGASNSTPQFKLPIFTDDDKPTWLGDMNNSHNIIENSLVAITDVANAAKADAAGARAAATAAENISRDNTTAVTGFGARLTDAESAVAQMRTQVTAAETSAAHAAADASRAAVSASGVDAVRVLAERAQSDAREAATAAAMAAVPAGTVLPFAGMNVPTGFLLCRGQEVSRTEYPALYRAIGETWGAGDGSTTFNLPPSDVFMFGASGDNSVGKRGGKREHTLSLNEIPAHRHDSIETLDYTLSLWRASGIASDSSGPWAVPDKSGNGAIFGSQLKTSLAGGGRPFSLMPPYAAFNFIIKH